METLEVLDVITHSPYASSQEVLSSATRTQSNDVSVLAMYDAQVGLTLSTLLYCVQVLSLIAGSCRFLLMIAHNPAISVPVFPPVQYCCWPIVMDFCSGVFG
jgi:hypothetical protein